MKYKIFQTIAGWNVFDYVQFRYIGDFTTEGNSWFPFKTRAKARDALLRHKGREFITGWALKDNDLFALVSSHEFLSLNGKAIFCGQFDEAYKISHEQAIAYNAESVRTLERLCYYWFCETKKEIRSRAVVKDYKYPLGIKYS
jgi:hypothetical protein